MPTILVTNDDGISSPGIKVLAKTLKSIGDVYVVAPETEQSAVAHALTLHRPLKFQKVSSKTYYVNGTPTDCVIIGVNKILPHKPDIIVSGINIGANIGDDISYSGTVAAAIEGTFLGIPSIAVSLEVNNQKKRRTLKSVSAFQAAADFAGKITLKVLDKGLPENTLLNINVPGCAKINGMKITKQGKLVYESSIKELSDPRGNEYYWIGGGVPQWEPGENTDFEAIKGGFISVTPVHLDLTNHEAMKYLEENWKM
jgi:5'-nucleotidase